jgi:hypothetical protein
MRDTEFSVSAFSVLPLFSSSSASGRNCLFLLLSHLRKFCAFISSKLVCRGFRFISMHASSLWEGDLGASLLSLCIREEKNNSFALAALMLSEILSCELSSLKGRRGRRRQRGHRSAMTRRRRLAFRVEFLAPHIFLDRQAITREIFSGPRTTAGVTVSQ